MTLTGKNIRERFRGKKIAVIGDIVADQFLSGTISRVSREAPVFILKHQDTETRPGAAGNAAANVAALGGAPLLVGTVADDANGEMLRSALRSSGVAVDRIALRSGGRTTTKVRVLGGQTYAARKQVIRIDYEDDGPTSAEVQRKIMHLAVEAVDECDAVVMSDYNYGAATDELISALRERAVARRIPILADSRSGLRRFARFTSATPNQEEAEALLGRTFQAADADRLRAELDLGSLLVTLGGNGMALSERGGTVMSIAAVGSKQPVDVTGAGDTVMAAFALGLASGMSASEAASIANHAGGIVVMKRGTAVATIDELEDSLSAYPDPDAATAANEF
jgi:rfaE bifunctional protein kinase chain/domain